MLAAEKPHDDGRALRGLRVLIVEDDPFIMMDVETALQESGAEIAGTCSSVAGALTFVEGAEIDVAVLDFGLGRDTAAPIARALAARGTPFLFYTGQVSTDPRLAEWRDRTIVPKPVPPRVLVGAVARVVADRAG